MSSVFRDGAEDGDLALFSTVTITVSTNQKRSGNYAYRMQGTQSFVITLPSTYSEFYFRIPFYTVTGDFRFAFRSDSTNMIGIIRNLATGFLELRRGDWTGTLLLTGTTATQLNTFYMLEIYVKIHDTTGAAEMKIDGVSQGSISNADTRNGTPTTINNIYGLGPTSSDWYMDDLAFNSTDNSDGKNDNSWCGDGHIEKITVNGNSPDAGWTDDFTGSDGNSTDNYALVDETPPSSADYVEASVDGYQDRYALTDFDGTGKAIKRVWVEARALDTASAGGKLKLGLRINGADYLSAAKTLTGVYTRVLGDEYKVNPDDSGEWADGDLDAAQVVQEVAS